jgi:hypothetical protein
MNIFKLDRYINRVQNMIERKRKVVRNSQGDSYWMDSVKLDFYQHRLKGLLAMKKNGEDYYIKF